MRYFELFENDINADLKNDIMNILVNLQSQGINKITVPQILDNLRSKMEYNGLALVSNAVNDALDGSDNITVEPDMDNNGILTVEINSPDTVASNAQNKKSNADKVNDMAQNTIDKDING